MYKTCTDLHLYRNHMRSDGVRGGAYRRGMENNRQVHPWQENPGGKKDAGIPDICGQMNRTPARIPRLVLKANGNKSVNYGKTRTNTYSA